MTPIERRYQRLMRAYPGWYREQRGDEMLGTLMAAAPSGRWPSRRDSWALLTGGLRVRAGQDQRLGTRANLRLAALFGVALSLAWLGANQLTFTIQLSASAASYRPSSILFTYLAMTLVSAAMVWLAPWWVTAPLALTAAGFWLAGDGGTVFVVRPVVLLLLLAALARGKDRLPRLWLALAGVLVTVNVLQVMALAPAHQGYYSVLDMARWAILGLVVLWAVVDARPALAMAITLVTVYSLTVLLVWAGYGMPPIPAWQVWLPASGAAVLAAGALWRVRRQAVL